MHIYQTGLVSEAVREKIGNTRAYVSGGEKSTRSFGEVLRSLMPEMGASDKTRVVGTSYPDGRTLLYAAQNADTDSTAAAVLNRFGIKNDESTLSADAQRLMSDINLVNIARYGDKETLLPKLASLAESFNALLDDLKAQSTSSGFLYRDLLTSAVFASEQALSSSGFTADSDGRLSFDAESFEELDIDGFLSGISAAVGSVSSYASTIRNSSGLLDFLTESDDSGTAEYMTSLLGLINNWQ